MDVQERPAREPEAPRPSSNNRGSMDRVRRVSGHRRLVLRRGSTIMTSNDKTDVNKEMENTVTNNTDPMSLEDREAYTKEALKQSTAIENLRMFRKYLTKDDSNARLPRFMIEIEKELNEAVQEEELALN